MYQRLTYISIPDHKDWLLCLIRDYYFYNKKHTFLYLSDIAMFILDQDNVNGFAKWLQYKKWDAKFWKYESIMISNNSINHIANNDGNIIYKYGINIADNCPKFIEYKLTRM